MFSVPRSILEKKLHSPNTEHLSQEQKILLLSETMTVGRLIYRGRLETPQLKEIGAKFTSLLVHPLEPVAELVKIVIRQMRKTDHETVADCLLDAMMESFDRPDSDARESFIALSQKISNLYVVFNNAAAKAQVYHFLHEGIQKAMEAAVQKSGLSRMGCHALHPSYLERDPFVNLPVWKPRR